ncbi:MAG: bifunctional ADP-dependent NAD(P)H-hydrate dehydratase/NAD(P)H-hydrate epimerase [Fluviicola sp.]|nr:MAG: bifunctional ADP-dependent NAD(P)H-hydrate dehydratase/NAD(P)H-hydrate epimerase [Fluviicola sp.]
MIGILSAENQRNLDGFTIENEPISSVNLMERAAVKCFEWLLNNYNSKSSISIFCGPGNNGGDGLVIARHLHESNFNVNCFVVAFSKNFSDEFIVNKKRLESVGVKSIILDEEKDLDQLKPNDIIIEAVFGTGLSRPAEGFAKTAIEKINSLNAEVVSVDIPSGMYCNDLHDSNDVMIKATHTLTFQAPKLNFFFPETGNNVGELHVLDIGLLQDKISDFKVDKYMLTKESIGKLIKKRNTFSHKGTYGHAQVIAGSRGKMGAAILSSSAALKTGAGLVTVNTPQCGIDILQSTIPEVMVLPNEGSNELEGNFNLIGDTIGIGPGVGLGESTVSFLKNVIEKMEKPIVIDADALNILASNQRLLTSIPEGSILTPHPKEFERLVGSFSNSYERLEKQIEFSKKHKVIVVLKDARTQISDTDGVCYFSAVGNPGMATGGSGDVLTGVLTGLLAQKYKPIEAAQLGVYLHGTAGDLAAELHGQQSLVASDLIEMIGKSYGELSCSDL